MENGSQNRPLLTVGLNLDTWAGSGNVTLLTLQGWMFFNICVSFSVIMQGF